MPTMLEGLFGNRTAERALLHLYHYGEIHASAVANDYRAAVHPIRRQLERFERSGVLVSRVVGRARVYAFNPKSPLTAPLREILRVAYEGMPLDQRTRIFQGRRRPRRAGKPVL